MNKLAENIISSINEIERQADNATDGEWEYCEQVRTSLGDQCGVSIFREMTDDEGNLLAMEENIILMEDNDTADCFDAWFISNAKDNVKKLSTALKIAIKSLQQTQDVVGEEWGEMTLSEIKTVLDRGTKASSK